VGLHAISRRARHRRCSRRLAGQHRRLGGRQRTPGAGRLAA